MKEAFTSSTHRPPSKTKIFTFVLATLLVGVLAGLFLRREKGPAKAPSVSREPIEILSYRGVVDPLLLQVVTKSRGVQVNMQEAANPEELMNLWKNSAKPLDLVLLLPDQLAESSREGRIQAVTLQDLPSLKRISSDFRFIADHLGGGAVPILWGIHQRLEPKPGDDNKPLLWIYSWALTSNAKNRDSALIFLDEMTTGAAALSLVNSSKFASTSLEIEKEKVDDRLKPSFLRAVSLSSFEIEGFAQPVELREIATPETH